MKQPAATRDIVRASAVSNVHAHPHQQAPANNAKIHHFVMQWLHRHNVCLWAINFLLYSNERLQHCFSFLIKH